MRTIYKYKLNPGITNLELQGPILSCGVQGDNIMVWAIYDEAIGKKTVKVETVGTGHPLFWTIGKSISWNRIYRRASFSHLCSQMKKVAADHIIYCYACRATYLTTDEVYFSECRCPWCKSDYVLCSSPGDSHAIRKIEKGDNR